MTAATRHDDDGRAVARPAVTRIYLRALGILEVGAAEAVARGWARPLGGPDRAFTACRLSRRGRSGAIDHLMLPVTALKDWLDGQRSELRASVATQLSSLASAAPPLPGLPGAWPLIMGVVNVTPDSFSDGGQFLSAEAAIAHGLRLHAEGAAIVDVGGESTRPGAAPVAVDEELRRVLPVIEGLVGAGVAVSIDTRRAAIMTAAIEAGVRLINDVSALRHDPDSLAVAGASGLPVVLMHLRGEPRTMQRSPSYDDVLLDIHDHLAERIDAWTTAGFERGRLALDPGIGFGKTVAHNLEVLRGLDLYRGFGLPLVLGVSRKSFIERLTGAGPAADRLPGSLAAGLHGLDRGVAVLRVHDVAATRQAVGIWRALHDSDGFAVEC